MASTEMGKDGVEVGRDAKVTKDPAQLLADAREAWQDAVDAVLGLMPQVEHRLPPVYPRIDVASVLTISRHHTEVALQNVHAQVSDLIWTHVAGPEQAGVFFNTILPITCSFQHQMDEMAINLLFPGGPASPQCVGCPAGSLRGAISGGASELLGQLASFSGGTGHTCSGYFWSVGSSKTPTKLSNPGAGKLTPVRKEDTTYPTSCRNVLG